MEDESLAVVDGGDGLCGVEGGEWEEPGGLDMFACVLVGLADVDEDGGAEAEPVVDLAGRGLEWGGGGGVGDGRGHGGRVGGKRHNYAEDRSFVAAEQRELQETSEETTSLRQCASEHTMHLRTLFGHRF